MPNVALSSPHRVAIKCFMDCLGQTFPLARCIVHYAIATTFMKPVSKPPTYQTLNAPYPATVSCDSNL